MQSQRTSRGRVFEVSFQTATPSRRGLRDGLAQCGLISVLFSVYVNDMAPPSQNLEFTLYADDTTIIATSSKPTLLVRYLESYLNGLQRWLSEWRIAIIASKSIARAERRFLQLLPVTLFGELIEWVDTSRYLGVTIHTRLTWALYIAQVTKRAAQRPGMVGTLLNMRDDLSVRNGVVLFKQLIRCVLDYACPMRRSAALTHVRRLRMLQSKCLYLATDAPWYVSNRRIREDLGVPLFAVHIRVMTESFDSNLSGVGNPLARQGGRYLR